MSRLLHWLGFHEIVEDQHLITMSRCHCRICGKRFINSMFGLFDA